MSLPGKGRELQGVEVIATLASTLARTLACAGSGLSDRSNPNLRTLSAVVYILLVDTSEMHSMRSCKGFIPDRTFITHSICRDLHYTWI
jgi:hypothetical protein